MPKVSKQVATTKKTTTVSSKRTNRGANAATFRDRVRPVQQVRTGLGISLYGRQGSGKTRYACTFPKPILVIGAENGTKSVSTDKDVHFGELRRGYDIVDAAELAIQEDYATVVLDTATALQMLVLKEVLELDQIPEQLSWGIARQQDWGTIANQMKEYFRVLLDLREREKNVIIIAQEKDFSNPEDEVDEELNAPTVAPALTKSSAAWLIESTDYIVQTFIRPRMITKTVKVAGKSVKRKERGEGVDFCLRTGPDAVYTTKVRVPRGTELPDVVVNPTYENTKHLFGL